MTPVAAPGVGVATLPAASEPLEVARPASPAEPAGARVLRLAHGRLTLDELVSGAWAAVAAGFPAACPICDGPMSGRRPDAPDGVLAGSRAEHAASCRDCGAELS